MIKNSNLTTFYSQFYIKFKIEAKHKIRIIKRQQKLKEINITDKKQRDKTNNKMPILARIGQKQLNRRTVINLAFEEAQHMRRTYSFGATPHLGISKFFKYLIEKKASFIFFLNCRFIVQIVNDEKAVLDCRTYFSSDAVAISDCINDSKHLKQLKQNLKFS